LKHIPRKRFGQHFLSDGAIIDAIIRAIAPLPGQHVVEIGPGLAAITQPLVERLGALTVIELDRDLAAQLRAHAHLQVIESDVLKVDFSQIKPAQATSTLPPSDPKSAQEAAQDSMTPASMGSGLSAGPIAGSAKMRVVGNLPYNISTPILFHLLGFAHLVTDQHFMLQKEVIDRMVASPSTTAYGRLSVMLQWRYAMENVLDVPPESFDPPPRVMSAVVRMVPLASPALVKFELLQELVQVAFSMRRKLLRHSLGKWLEQRNYAGQFDLQRRAEEVPVDQFLRLALEVQ
jgi:16S rRNA (adenine1518-N6/adenine1519-N6)-dimethyltransferase